MKKSLKKNLAILLTLLITVSLVPFSASAQTVGYAGPTDIVAMINGYQIESYNVDGYTYICVEDLKYYGFDVVYDNYSRTLSFNRNWGVYAIAPHYSNPNFWSIGSSNTRRPILATDIAAYAAGSWVASANINGQTIINFNELSRFGQVNYDNDRREITLTMPGITVNPLLDLIDDSNLRMISQWKTTVRVKGNMLIVKHVNTSISENTNVSNYTSFVNSVKSGSLYNSYKNNIKSYNSHGYDVSSVYVEYYTKDGYLIVSNQIYK